mmetsp:Transcript_4539/g.11225  ORF Transcript_4539/g.11225 Transcript_4539/m.11225 type:complete len:436 (-) Transcript_4539:2169-3476(-)
MPCLAVSRCLPPRPCTATACAASRLRVLSLWVLGLSSSPSSSPSLMSPSSSRTRCAASSAASRSLYASSPGMGTASGSASPMSPHRVCLRVTASVFIALSSDMLGGLEPGLSAMRAFCRAEGLLRRLALSGREPGWPEPGRPEPGRGGLPELGRPFLSPRAVARSRSTSRAVTMPSPPSTVRAVSAATPRSRPMSRAVMRPSSSSSTRADGGGRALAASAASLTMAFSALRFRVGTMGPLPSRSVALRLSLPDMRWFRASRPLSATAPPAAARPLFRREICFFSKPVPCLARPDGLRSSPRAPGLPLKSGSGPTVDLAVWPGTSLSSSSTSLSSSSMSCLMTRGVPLTTLAILSSAMPRLRFLPSRGTTCSVTCSGPRSACCASNVRRGPTSALFTPPFMADGLPFELAAPMRDGSVEPGGRRISVPRFWCSSCV